ncbi:hypothetical protein POM88_031556 [Heracleum sosnowskyi]|uniref:Uncharacterized protein n=1 Tax=Heracleum sosnowskyi TaxID=360622 RepID=A0AAD8MKH1_9APIA|nr:hypothetical protein POM88_031556 [Heracleum sosnowskyi]
MGARTRPYGTMESINETDEAAIAAACVAEKGLESGKISSWLSLTLKWLGTVIAVLLYCSTVVLVMLLYPAVGQHPERVLILILLVILWFVFALCIYAFLKDTYNKTKEYKEAIKLIRKADSLQGVADLRSIVCF